MMTFKRLPVTKPWCWNSMLLKGLSIPLVGILLGVVVLFLDQIPEEWAQLVLVIIIGIFVVFMIGDLHKTLIAAVLIDIPLNFDIYIGGPEAISSYGMRFGFFISATTIAVAGLYLLQMLKGIVYRSRQSQLVVREALPLTLYMFFVCISILVARYTQGAIFQVFFLAQMYLLYLYIASFIHNKKEVKLIYILLLTGLFLEGVIMIAQYFFSLHFHFSGINIASINVAGKRATGTFGSPNVAASYLSLLLVPAFSILFTDLPRKYKWLATLAFTFGLFGLLLTQSRGGIVATAISVGLFCLILTKQGRMPVWLLMFFFLLAIFIISLLFDTILNNLFLSRSNAAMSRLSLAAIATRMILSHPILGVGANNYSMNIRYFLPQAIPNQFLYTVHNKYLLVWAETGIGGILTFLIFLYATIRQGWRLWQRNTALLSPISLGIITAIAGQMVHMMVDVFDSRTQVESLWLLAGLIIAMSRFKDRV